jgi:hypothetical protein
MPSETEINGKFHTFPHTIVMPTEAVDTVASLLTVKSIASDFGPGKFQRILNSYF